jgi:hypothetical protein
VARPAHRPGQQFRYIPFQVVVGWNADGLPRRIGPEKRPSTPESSGS